MDVVNALLDFVSMDSCSRYTHLMDTEKTINRYENELLVDRGTSEQCWDCEMVWGGVFLDPDPPKEVRDEKKFSKCEKV